MLMNPTDCAVRMPGAELRQIRLRVPDLIIQSLGVARGKFHTGQQVKADRALHRVLLEKIQSSDQRKVPEAGNRSGFIDRSAGREQLRPPEIPVKNGRIEAQPHSARKIVARHQMRVERVQVSLIQKWNSGKGLAFPLERVLGDILLRDCEQESARIAVRAAGAINCAKLTGRSWNREPAKKAKQQDCS